ncbi:hypothetical protein FB446DRAFT_699227 [Lentinula raphanica]|uniref:Uncharacterized protein n=1 Tax=Lentinula raphanica TaxID=153919 RepID=A0AA38PA68_9AGAR|nr:hypothetical protein FB446DRAFT_699227 [Lentinula raphanica]KAJ3829453.1 hypothetical protein F5880DRAFT_399580 [Lentinula raphanica]KAJ3839135.1 hypothetical protein F5878DRAFT_709669 [Lentinula raphanica]
MISLRSWYFVVSFMLVRCRCHSATLESKDVNPYEGDTLSTLMKRNDFTGVTPLFRRSSISNTESTIFAILTGVIAGILALLVFFVCVYSRLRRHQDVDIEKDAISLDTDSSATLRPSSRASYKDSTRSPSHRNSRAFLQLRFARRKLWASLAKESPHLPQHPYPFPQPDDADATGPQRYASLPFQDVPPLSKPKAAVVPSESFLAHTRLSPTHREKNMPLAALLPVDGGVLSVPASVAAERDDDEAFSRRQAQFAPPHVVASPGGTGNAVVAQTIIANKQKPRQPHTPLESTPRSPSRSRKGSLLSGPPLTVENNGALPSPTEEESVDIGSHFASLYMSSEDLEEQILKMLAERGMTDTKVVIQRD